MTKTEIAALLALNKVHFPYAYKDMTKEEKNILLESWTSLLEGYDNEFIKLAFCEALKVCKVPVTTADIFEQIRKAEETRQQSPEKLWSIFMGALSRASGMSKEEYNRLPFEIKEFCGSQNQFWEYGQLDTTELVGYVKPQFIKRVPHFREVKKVTSQLENLLENQENAKLEEGQKDN